VVTLLISPSCLCTVAASDFRLCKVLIVWRMRL
jgi:hypothetical protein